MKRNFFKNLINQIKRNFILNQRISLHEPVFNSLDYDWVKTSLKSTHVSTSGKFTNIFEKNLKKFTNSKNVISTINGTSALHTILKIIGTKTNDEVLLPSLTFVGTANSILYCNAIPNFIDVDYETFGVDPYKLEKYLKRNCIIKNNKCFNIKSKKFIKALICVHVFGQSCKIDQLVKLCKKFKIFLIEDAAEAIGSYYRNKHLGTFGDFGTISFNGNKTITTGGGGAILFKNKKFYNKIFKLVTVAKEKHKFEYYYKELGYNYRMPSLNAALGISQLKNIKQNIKKKRKIFKFYKKLFEKFPEIELLEETQNMRSNYWLNTIILDNANKKKKNSIIKKLIKNNFLCRPLWYPIHKLPYFKTYPRDNLKVTEDLYSRCINIPSSTNLFDFIKK